MKWSSSVSAATDLDDAIAEVTDRVRRELGAKPDLAVVFVSPHHRAGYEDLPRKLASRVGAQVMIGCSAGGVTGGGHEVEELPGLSLTAATLSEVQIRPFRIRDVHELTDASRWSDILPGPDRGAADFLLLADPFTFDAE